MTDALLSAAVNVVLLGALPLGAYGAVQRWRHGRGVREVLDRAGLRTGDPRHVGYAAIAAAVSVAALLVWSPPTGALAQEGSALHAFRGLGLGPRAAALALLYGAVQTGFPEELLFRGLVAGSLARRLSDGWANLMQALIFLLPHLFILVFMPEMWGLLPVIFAGGLFLGWLRIASGSILAPWLVHASANVTMALLVAGRAGS